MDQYGAIDDVFYFHFAANTTAGAAGDGATPVCHVRLCGALASAAPVYNPTPDLLTHVTYLDGSHEVAITASVANGFAAGSSYAVFASLTISSITPGGFLGRIHLKPCIANVTHLGGVAQSATDLKDFADTGYDPSTHKVATDKTGYALAADGANGVTLTTGDLYRSYLLAGGGKLTVTDADGSWALTKADGSTAAASGSITDNLISTVRSVPTWV